MAGVTLPDGTKPDPLLLLAAIRDIGMRFGLRQDDPTELMRDALFEVYEQANLALRLLNLSSEDIDRLTARWDLCRVDQRTPKYLRDPSLRALGKHVRGLTVSITDFRATNDNGNFHFNFEYHCTECGGYEINLPDERSDESTVTCSACGQTVGTFAALTALCQWKARQELRRLGLGQAPDP